MSSPIDTESLRPIERRVLDMRHEGVPIDEIAARFNRTPAFVERLITWTEIPRTGRSTDRHLTPLQQRVLALRAEGESHEQIATRFKRGRRYIRQVEGLAHFKESLRLLNPR
jgi:transcriptional regulator